jgi:hypothetical protein
MSWSDTITDVQQETMLVRRGSRDLDAVIRRLRRSHADACVEFRDKPLSRRKRTAERRKDLRQPLHVPVYLTPCSLDGNQVTQAGEPVMGVTRDVSDQGIGFAFDQNIKSTHVLAEFDIYGRGPVTLLVEVRWTARKSPHSFVGGGLWIGIVGNDEP